MDISPSQCRAARGLLNWTQGVLANKVGVGVKTIRDFESGKRQPHPLTLAAITQSFEQAGIEFLDNNGLRFKT